MAQPQPDDSVAVIALVTATLLPRRRVLIHAERDGRARRLPPPAESAAAGAADHGGRDVLHPPGRRPRPLGRRVPDHREADPEHGRLLDRRVNFQWDKLSVIMLTIPVLLVLTWLVTSTRQGRRCERRHRTRTAAMMGINVNRTISFTFALRPRARGRRRPALLPALHVDALRHRLPDRVDRAHGSGAGRDRQPDRRRARRGLHRPDRTVQRRARALLAGRRLDAIDDLRDPDRGPRLPAGGSARRADAGGAHERERARGA